MSPFAFFFVSSGVVFPVLCRRYRPAARTKSDVDSGTSNQGFRCAADWNHDAATGRPSVMGPTLRGDKDEGGDVGDAGGADSGAGGAAVADDDDDDDVRIEL